MGDGSRWEKWVLSILSVAVMLFIGIGGAYVRHLRWSVDALSDRLGALAQDSARYGVWVEQRRHLPSQVQQCEERLSTLEGRLENQRASIDDLRDTIKHLFYSP